MAEKPPIDSLSAKAEEFAAAFTAWDGEEMQAEVAAAFSRLLSSDARCALAFQLLTFDATDMELPRESRIFAVDLADTIGPDWAQWLYHFAKLVTKVA